MKFLIVLVSALAAVSAYNAKSKFMTLLDYYNYIDDGRIIDGTPAEVGQFPWQVAVNFIVSGSSYFCGGALISNQWVLTAAHCADGASSFTLRLGTILSSGGGSGSITVQTTTAFVHEGYNSNLNNDVALIKLNEPIAFSNVIQPIDLPSKGDTAITGETLRVSGWGKTNDNGSVSSALNYVDLTAISNTQCANYYGSATIISSTLCCVGNPHHSTCNGDSGGPLVRVNGNRVTHHGIVSFVSSAGCASGAPSGYVRTESMLDWISSKTGIKVE
ncbi:brachyurin-like [Onthophagus taurus]|uniref:brachyurin-like n=1 Tax=Onthophagus taurus TaxID=166361 RepID=UPI0039BE9A6F